MENVAYLEVDDINPDGSLKPYVNNGKPVILMCQGNFCGYCTQAKPAFEELAKLLTNVVCATLVTDGEESEKAAAKFIKIWDKDYRGVPHYIGFDKNGKIKKIHSGGRDKKALETFCNSL
jgi:thiol-disulfide isomerase/thioredoxin